MRCRPDRRDGVWEDDCAGPSSSPFSSDGRAFIRSIGNRIKIVPQDIRMQFKMSFFLAFHCSFVQPNRHSQCNSFKSTASSWLHRIQPPPSPPLLSITFVASVVPLPLIKNAPFVLMTVTSTAALTMGTEYLIRSLFFSPSR